MTAETASKPVDKAEQPTPRKPSARLFTGLTAVEGKVLAYITAERAAGRQPTNWGIAQHCGWTSVGPVGTYLNKLTERGHIRREGTTNNRRILVAGIDFGRDPQSPSNRDASAGGEACQADVASGNPPKSEPPTGRSDQASGERSRHEGHTREGAGYGKPGNPAPSAHRNVHKPASKAGKSKAGESDEAQIAAAIAAGKVTRVSPDGKVPERDAIDRLANWMREAGYALGCKPHEPGGRCFVVNGTRTLTLVDLYKELGNRERGLPPIARQQVADALKARRLGVAAGVSAGVRS